MTKYSVKMLRRSNRNAPKYDYHIDAEIRNMDRYFAEVTKSKQNARAFLLRAGIIDKKGDLTSKYK